MEGESEEKAERLGEEQAEEAEEKTQEAKTEEERAPEVDEEARREAQREAMADEMADAIAEMEEDEEELEEAQERKSAETERETERPGVDDGDEPLTEEAEELEDPKLRNEVIEYFLLQGTLPNRYDTLSESQVMELLLDFAREMPRRLVKIIKENAHSPVARMRWASFSEEVTEYMLLLLLPDLQRRHFHAYLVLLRQVFSQPGAPVPVSALTAHAFEYFAEATATDYRMDEYVRSLLKKIDRDSPFSAVWTIEWIMQVLAGKSSPIGLSFREVLIAIRPEYEPLKDTEEEISEDTELIPEEEAEKRKVPEPEPEEDPTIFINNAGLAVVFALLPSIFKSMEFLNEKGDFINDAVRERAIHFLAYLTHQQEKTPEEELVLNKILIGWPIDRSIMKNVPLSDAEKQVAEEVIAEIVEKWPGMEGTNNMSFRKSWFQRDGRLEPDSTETWVLRVDQRGFDMLLDKLPWRYSKFEAPWAKDTIRVEWR